MFLVSKKFRRFAYLFAFKKLISINHNLIVSNQKCLKPTLRPRQFRLPTVVIGIDS